MRQITLVNGKSYEVDSCGEADDVLWINLVGKTIKQCVTILTPANCQVIIHTVAELRDEYVGYTDLAMVETSKTGTLCALKREVVY